MGPGTPPVGGAAFPMGGGNGSGSAGSNRPMTARTSILQRLTFQSKPVTVVPYAPERLSITQDVLTPTMQAALAEADRRLSGGGGSTNGHGGGEPVEQTNTLFAALKMRRALQRAKAGRATASRQENDDSEDNMSRHMKVLSRYKIRRVDIDEDEQASLKDLGWFLINPHSTIFKMWQLSTLVLILYQSVILPYGLAFGDNGNAFIDVFTNAVFMFDILVAFNTPVAASADESEFITDRKEIAKIYLKGWFFFDLLACLPFDQILKLFLTDSSKGGGFNALGLLKALRVPRLLRLVRLLRVVKVLRIRPEIRRWLQYSRHANILRLVRLVASFLVLNHYIACIWYGGVASEAFKRQDPSTEAKHLYVVSFYTTLLVIMGQNITIYEDSEYLFCIAAMLFGSVLMAVVFGNVAILISNYYENQSTHQKKMEWLFASMTRMKLPMELQNRINDYYQAMWERHGTLDGAVTAFIPELSRNLAYEVELFLRMDMINRAPIFQSCSAKVVQELVMELELQVFMPGDYVVVRGEVGNDMYFVQNGLCEVTKDMAPNTTQSFQQSIRGSIDMVTNEIVLKTLGQGDYFGEIALLMNCKRTANVRAHIFSELCVLTREVFENISMRYLEDRNIIEKFIMDKYDPSMLQAAMKQSQELTMRSSTVTAATPPPRPSIFKRATTPIHDHELLDLLRRIEERLVRLEHRIESDSRERRESETHRQSLSASHTAGEDKTNSGPRHPHAEYMLFEPERVSQRHLLSPLQRQSANGREITDAAEEAKSIVEGEATEESADQKRQVWKRPSIHRSGSWRNARREGSTDGLRLRGLVKPGQAATAATRHSSRAASLTAAIAAAEATHVQHSILRTEPTLRDVRAAAAPDLEDDDTLSADTLDDLASTLSQYEQRGAEQTRAGPRLVHDS